MADVGKKTGKKTQAGRNVYKTPEGEMVSEKSTTFKYKGKWINIPTIHGGNQYSEDELMQLLDKGLVKPTSVHNELKDALQAAQERSESLKFNKGGTPMKDQMELFEDGGLKDEGGMIDEESGNEVPIGGTKKGVRDDVPAMVSEGEFVFPEDVTRYIGLDKLMRLRQEAKMGLKRMEAMGQMGNGDEATIPDDMPFGMADLVIVAGDTGEELEMQEGGFVTRPTTVTRTQPQPTYTPPPQQPTVGQPTTTRRLTPEIQRPERTPIDFKKLMGEASITYVEYRNEAGANMMIPHIGGVPVFPIPEGYTIYSPENEDSVENSNTVEGNVVKEINKVSRGEGGPDRDITAEIQAEYDNAPAPINWGELGTEELIAKSNEITGTGRLIANGAMLLMGPVGAFGYIAMRDQDKKAYAAIVAKLEAGGLSPEERASLTELRDTLGKTVGPESKSIFGNIIDGITNAFSLPTTKAEEAKVKIKQEEVLPTVPVETAPTPEEVLMQQPVTAAPVQTGDPEAFTYSPSVVDMKRPDVPITFGGGDPTLPSTTFAAAPTIPAPIDPYGVGQQGEFALTGTGGYDEQPIMQGAEILGQLEAPISYVQPSPTATKIEVTPYEGSVEQAAALSAAEQMRRMTEERKQQRLQVIDPEFTAGLTAKPYTDSMYGEVGRGVQPSPVPVSPTGSYDEAGLAVDPRKPITTTGGAQATVFQEKQAAEAEAKRKQELQESKDRAEAQEKLRLQEQQEFAASLKKQQETSAAELSAAKEAADLIFNVEINKIRREQADEIETLVAQGVDRALAEATAAKKAKEKEDTAKETKQYTETLAETGTATRTGTAAPATSIKPKAKPTTTTAAKPSAPESSNDKSTRLDSSNPNTNKNITNHLSNVEKESLKANPALTGHYTATANRRANEAAGGDTSNTDAANEASDNKIVCTAMNNSYGFGSYRQAIWLSYSKDYLTKEHELGYHTLFLPLVDLAYNKNNKFVRKALEHIARHRTADLRASMQNKKRDTLGRIYRSILEPLVYTVGKFRTITGI